MKIVVASTNPVKLACVERGFSKMFQNAPIEIEGIEVASGVADQPMSNEETIRGAKNRAERARGQRPEADFWVGIEGGADEENGDLCTFAWIVVTDGRRLGRARTGTFFQPPAVVKLMREGMELGHADDVVFGRKNSKQQNGAVGLLTHDVIDRTELYSHAVVLALVPFVNPDHYPGSDPPEHAV